MNVQTRPTMLDSGVQLEAPPARRRSTRAQEEQREFNRLVAAAFLILLVPAALGRLSGWRWQPWPPGRQGYRSIVGEAREAAETYVTMAFLGY